MAVPNFAGPANTISGGENFSYSSRNPTIVTRIVTIIIINLFD
jgi:hypothetical protein